jgi:hypothetical protein
MSKSFFSEIMISSIFLIVISCDKWIPDNQEVVARVGTKYLYKNDLSQITDPLDTRSDSIIKSRNFIDSWARDQILLQKAQINLSDNEIDNLKKLVEDYKLDIYGNAYQQTIASRSIDTFISVNEIDSFLYMNKSVFKLKSPLFKIRYIHLPPGNVDENRIQLSFQRFNDEDKFFLDSLSFQYTNYMLSDSLWISRNNLKSKVQFLKQNNFNNYVKKSKFFKIEDSLGVYLFFVKEILNKGDMAPREVTAPTIRNIIINQRKLKFAKKFEQDIIQDAIKSKTYEMY